MAHCPKKLRSVTIPGLEYHFQGHPERRMPGKVRTLMKWQGRAYKALMETLRRICIAPTGSGKSTLVKALALHDLQAGFKVVVSVPQHVIAEGFVTQIIKLPDGSVLKWCPATTAREATVAGLISFLKNSPTPDMDGRIFVCTHQTLVLALTKLGACYAAWKGTSLFIDETHHSKHDDADVDAEEDDDPNNQLGKVVKQYLDHEWGPLTLVTATWLRKDGRIVGGQKHRFTTFVYYMDEYIEDNFKKLTISVRFIVGPQVESLQKLVATDPKRKTIVYFPATGPGGVPAKERLLEACKAAPGRRTNGGAFETYSALKFRTCDFVTLDDRDTRQAALLDAIKEQKDAYDLGHPIPTVTPDLLWALRTCQEGFDWPEASRAILLAPRGSLIDLIQMLGRLLRRWPGKDHVEFNIILPVDPDEEVEPEKMLAYLKAMFACMVVEMQFKRRNRRSKGSLTVVETEAEAAAYRLCQDPELMEAVVTGVATSAVDHDGSAADWNETLDEVLKAAAETEPALLQPDVHAAFGQRIMNFFNRATSRLVMDAKAIPLDAELRKEIVASPFGAISLLSMAVGCESLRDLRERLGREREWSLAYIDEKIREFHEEALRG